MNAETATKNDIHDLRMNTAMVFQQYNLFKNLNILHNVMIGLTTVKKLKVKKQEKLVNKFYIK